MRWWVLVLLLGVAAGDDDRAAKDIRNPALERKINEAIAKGVAYLKSIQRAEGYWSGPAEARDFLRSSLNDGYVGGMSALCLYALGASGVAKDDPVVEKGLNFLFEHRQWFGGGDQNATYANSALVLALTRIDPVAYRTPLYEAADRLVQGQMADGMWTYILEPIRTGAPARAGDRTAWRKGSTAGMLPDNSNTQFSVLALWAAQEMAGFDVPRDAWEDIRKHFLKSQEKDGGWTYRKLDSDSTRTMTAAGVVSLVYALTSLDRRDDALARARDHEAVKRGVRRLHLEDMRDSWINYYWTYSVERVGTVLDLDVATWYVPGATWLVEQQAADGSWGRGAAAPVPAEKQEALQSPYATSLALLFLTRASRHWVTTRGGGTVEGPVTRKDTGPDTIEGLFDLYVATRPADREALVPKLARKEAVGLAIGKLRDGRQPVREAAFELLTRLVDRPFLFDPKASVDDRETMLGPIEAFWKEKGERLTWDEKKGMFVVP
jgi:hypothetical protein